MISLMAASSEKRKTSFIFNKQNEACDGPLTSHDDVSAEHEALVSEGPDADVVHGGDAGLGQQEVVHVVVLLLVVRRA